MQQPARNAEATAGEHATLALVEEVLSADSDDILEEVKTRGTWLSAADSITYGESPPAPAEGAPAVEEVAGNADAALALEEAKRRIAELERQLAGSELREGEANERAARAEFSGNLRSLGADTRAASAAEAVERSAADADAREREHGRRAAATALAAAADGAPDEALSKGTPRRAPGRDGGVEKRGAGKSPAEASAASPTPRVQHDFAGDFTAVASDEEDEMGRSMLPPPIIQRPRQKKKSRAEDQSGT